MAKYLWADASQKGTSYVGIVDFGDAGWRFFGQCEEALHGVFELTERGLQSSRVGLKDIDGFVYCEGPGSVLSLKIVTMAIQTWNLLPGMQKPVFAYDNLFLMKKIIELEGLAGGKYPFYVIAKARKGVCFLLEVKDPSENGHITHELPEDVVLSKTNGNPLWSIDLSPPEAFIKHAFPLQEYLEGHADIFSRTLPPKNFYSKGIFLACSAKKMPFDIAFL
jgi:tRNA A37 threonylcarbamoyladenosine modification protein TsaB